MILPVAARPTAADRLYAALAPPAFGLLRAGARALGTAPEALRQRAGMVPDCAAPLLWLHGASAGEMAAAANLVALLRARGVAFAAAYTTTNAAGLELIARRRAPGDVHCLAPWDAPRWVGRALDHWRPAALVLVETEIWPGLILAAAQRGIPVLCASARIYPRDVARYRFVRAFLRPTWRRLSAVLAQSEEERARFVDLGAPADRCQVVGNLKHAALAPPAADVQAFRHSVGIGADEAVWIAGSVHADEAALLCAAIAQLPAERRRVVIAPRHGAALQAIEAGARARGWPVERRGTGRRGWSMLLLDTIGELRTAYASAAVAAVGGSFAAHGGHDLGEPLRCGVPVLFGPHTAHVEAEASALRAAEPAAVVATPAALAARIAAWMSDPATRQAVLARQRGALPAPELVAERYASAFDPWLSTCRAAANVPPSF